jgi:hypothetical protein
LGRVLRGKSQNLLVGAARSITFCTHIVPWPPRFELLRAMRH